MSKVLRKKKLVSWKVQGPIVARLITHFLAYNAALLFLLTVLWGIRAAMTSVADPPTVDGHPLWQHVAPLLFCMVIMIPMMIWDLLRLTNRIAGPLYRFERHLGDFVRNGTLKTVQLRKEDLLQDFQAHFNEFAEALHTLHPETRPTTAGSNADSQPELQQVTTDAAVSSR